MKKKLLLLIPLLALLLTMIPTPALAYTDTIERRVEDGDDDILVYYTEGSWKSDRDSGWVQAGWYGTTHERLGSGMRFTDIDVPQGADISRAYLTITARTNDTEDVRSRIRGEDVNNAPAFSSTDNYKQRRGIDGNEGRVTRYVNWSIDETWHEGKDYRSPNIAVIIEEIVSRSGWDSGNDIVLFWDDHEGRSEETYETRRAGYSYEGKSSDAPELYIEYTSSYIQSYDSDNIYDIYDQLIDHTDELSTKIDELDTEITNLRSQASSLVGLENRLSNSLTNSLTSSLTSSQASMHDRLNSIGAKVEATSASVASITKEIDDLKRSLDSTTGSINTLTTGLIEHMNTLDEEQNTRIDELEKKLKPSPLDWILLALALLLLVMMFGLIRKVR